MLPELLDAQTCGLEAPIEIPANQVAVQSIPITIEGYLNNDLSAPGQGVCEIELAFRHRFVEDLELWVVSPNEQDTVQLIGPNTDDQFAFTDFARWDVSFLPSTRMANPDPGNAAIWTNGAPSNWVSGGLYTGSYYPHDGLLEDFDSGPVNGDWQILFRNNNGGATVFRDGDIIDFRIIFCDGQGNSCCQADAGTIRNVNQSLRACAGADTLDLDLQLNFFAQPPDSNEYGYTYVIARQDTILAFDAQADLRALPEGAYTVCGMSYLLADTALLPDPASRTILLDTLRQNLASPAQIFCGEITGDCKTATIDPQPVPTTIDTTVCDGSFFELNGRLYNTSQTIRDTVVAEGGCTEITLINLTVAPNKNTTIDSTICLGESVQIGDSTFSTEGNYTIPLQTAAGCDSIVNLNLQVISEIPATVDTAICAGETLQLGGQSFTVAGAYTILETSVNGCDSVVTLNLEVFDPQAVVAAPPNLTCNQPDGVLDGAASTPAGSIDFEWLGSSGEILGNDEQLTVSKSGDYQLVVRRRELGATCTDTATVTVAADTDTPIADAGPAQVLDCRNNQLMLGGGATTTGAAFDHQWQTADGNLLSAPDQPTVEVDAPGEYVLQVTNNQNGCEDFDTVLVTENLVLPEVDPGADTLLTCANPSLVLDGSGSATGSDFSYRWRGANGAVAAGADELTPTVNRPDRYTLIVTNEATGCVDSAAIEVGIDTLSPTVAIAPPPTLNCAVTSFTLNAAGSSSGADFDFVWRSTNGANIVADADTYFPEVNAAGTYELMITNTVNGCRDSAATVVSENVSTVFASIRGDVELTCRQDTLELDGFDPNNNSNVAYSWSTSDGGFVTDPNNPTVLVDQAGAYQLLVTDLLTFCEDSATVTVTTDRTLPVAEAGTDTTLNCNRPSLQLDGRGSDRGTPYLYRWTGPCITAGADSLQPRIDCGGVYYLEVTDTGSGCSNTDSVFVGEDLAPPLVEAGPEQTITCRRSVVRLDGAASDQGPELEVIWTGPGFLGSTDTLAPLAREVGMYRLEMTNSSNGCTATDSVMVTIDTLAPVADAGASAQVDCRDPEVIIGGAGTSTGPDFSYEWSTLNGNITGAVDQPTTTAAASGNYLLLVTDDNNGCQDTASVRLTSSLAPPFADAGSDRELNCADDQVLLDGSNSSGTGILRFQWTGDCLIAPADSSRVAVNCPGVYYLEVTDQQSGCRSRDSAIVQFDSVSPRAVVDERALLDCNTGTVVLDGSASANGDLEWWFNGSFTGKTAPRPTFEETGTYTLFVINNALDCRDSATVEVVLECQPRVAVARPDTLTCANPLVTLDASASTFGGAEPNLSLTPPDVGCVVGNPFANGSTQAQVRCGGEYVILARNPVFGLVDTVRVMVEMDTAAPRARIVPPDTLSCDRATVELDGGASSAGPDFSYAWTGASEDTLSRTPRLTVGEGGRYVLEVTDRRNGCKTVDFALVAERRQTPIIRFGTSAFPCERDTFGLQAFPDPPMADYAYSWSGAGILRNADQPMVTIDTAGAYTLSIRNLETGCTATDSVTVTDQACVPCLQADPPSDLTCNVNTVELRARYCAPCEGCTLEWSTAGGEILTSPDQLTITVGRPGAYLLTATDTLGFQNQLRLVVGEDRDPPPADAGPDRLITCEQTAVWIGSEFSATAPDLEYRWTALDGAPITFADSARASVAQPDTFVLQVNNPGSGCTALDTVVVTLAQDIPIADAGPVQTLTCEDPFTALDGSGSTFGSTISYLWSGPEGESIQAGRNSTNPVVSRPGIYLLEVIDLQNGCRSSDSVEVFSDLSLPTIPALPDTNLTCRDTALVLNVNLPGPEVDYRFSWCRLQGGASVDCVRDTSLTVSRTGVYQFELTDLRTGCTNRERVEVGEDRATPTAEAGPDQTLNCGEDAVVLQGRLETNGRAASYNWTNRGGVVINAGDSLQPEVSESGTYYLTVEDMQSGCRAVDSVSVMRDEATPDIRFAPDQPRLLTCAINELRLRPQINTNSGEQIIEWRTPDGRILSDPSAAAPLVDRPGTYRIRVTDPQNECVAEQSVQVALNDAPPESRIDSSGSLLLTCRTDTIALDGRGAQPLPGSSLNLEWQSPGGAPFLGGANAPLIRVTEPGAYQLIVTDRENGCRDTARVRVRARRNPPDVRLASPADLTCDRTSVRLRRIGGDDVNLELRWTGPNGVIPEGDGPAVVVTEPGNYQLAALDTQTGCRDSSRVTVGLDTLPPAFRIESPMAIDCGNPVVRLRAAVQLNSGRLRYEWSTRDGDLVTPPAASVAQVSAAGTYRLLLRDTVNGCTSVDSVTVAANEESVDGIELTLIPPSCEGRRDGRIQIDGVSGGLEPYVFALDSGVFVNRSGFDRLAAGDYRLSVQDAGGCTLDTLVSLPAPPPFRLELGADRTIALGDSVEVEAQIEGTYERLEWRPEVPAPGALRQVLSPRRTTVFVLRAFNPQGCVAVDRLTIAVTAPERLFVPSAFTPNGDGNNDRLTIYAGEDVSRINTFLIFDRWGNKVYESRDFLPNDPSLGWDGTFNGAPMDPAVFVFFAEVTFVDGTRGILEGDVLLAR